MKKHISQNQAKKYKNKDYLHNEYIAKKHSTSMIAKNNGVDSKTVYYWLKKYDISIRNRSIANKGKVFKPSKIYIKNNSLIVIANNTYNKFIFDICMYDKICNKSFREFRGYLVYGHNIHFAHHLVMPEKKGYVIDHMSRDKKDNRKSNLRYVTHSMNAYNATIRKDNTSGVTGVYFRKSTGKWESKIGANSKLINIGNFKDKKDAIISRQQAEKKYFNEIKYREA